MNRKMNENDFIVLGLYDYRRTIITENVYSITFDGKNFIKDKQEIFKSLQRFSEDELGFLTTMVSLPYKEYIDIIHISDEKANIVAYLQLIPDDTPYTTEEGIKKLLLLTRKSPSFWPIRTKKETAIDVLIKKKVGLFSKV